MNQSKWNRETHSYTSATTWERRNMLRSTTPPQQELCTNYMMILANCHLLHECDIMVIALLAHVAQRTKIAHTALKATIRDAHTEEIVNTRIAEYGCYVDLVKLIPKKNNGECKHQNAHCKCQQ